jgi:ABC-2 type transport system ATP-binding protein
MSANQISIEARGIRKKLGPTQALDGVDLTLGAGLLHGLIGPDGAGKTTLTRTLVGLLRPDEGTLRFTESGAPTTFEAVKPHMAYMPQTQSLYPDLSVSEHMDFFRDLYQIPADVYKERRAELLHITRLEPFTDRAASKLSGGMYKKLGLMCALLQSPSVVFLDEPTNGVDPISRREFWDLLYRLTSQGILVLMTTAYMDEAERCDRVHVLEKGRLLAEGEPREVMAKEGVTSFEELFLRRAHLHANGTAVGGPA